MTELCLPSLNSHGESEYTRLRQGIKHLSEASCTGVAEFRKETVVGAWEPLGVTGSTLGHNPNYVQARLIWPQHSALCSTRIDWDSDRIQTSQASASSFG